MTKRELFLMLPKVDELLYKEEIQMLLNNVSRILVVEAIREEIDKERRIIQDLEENLLENYNLNINKLVENILISTNEKKRMNLRSVINTTGVVLHTNLGRALLSDQIMDQIFVVANNYSNLEYELSTGKRGSRYTHIEEVLVKLTGAEGALVVNNNAAAVLLVLGTLAKGKEVIISRGQLVEIGGSFRIPEVMELSGAKLVEVGTTNKTHLFDYEKSINDQTRALLKVHTSNYKILGFTNEVELTELVLLGKKFNVPVIEDIGSGTLVDLSKYGLEKEPTVQESIAAGADIVTFSGDKLFGGPQAGIIVGKKKYIDLMKNNPLTRAIRVDKLTFAALEATLHIYLDEKDAIEKIPTLKMLTMPLSKLREKAEQLMSMIGESPDEYLLEIIEGVSQVGGGSLPLAKLPTILLTVKPYKLSVNQWEENLRNYKIPIISRINEDKLIFDVRTIKEKEFDIISNAIHHIVYNR
ncbi:MAG: L-seryl-tRNA(Sec) selenium transferase [Alkaliphilus sp.]|nr:L-seryl-tRNA(Sec) selenium transferase [Alkaliphilus sp.]